MGGLGVAIDKKNIPQETIIRLAYYLRTLNWLVQEKRRVVSSQIIASLSGINSYQLRKDLSYFGQLGKRGVGYEVNRLKEYLEEILGLQKSWFACIVGFGNLAKAISLYKGFYEQGVFIKAGFDIQSSKINKKIAGVQIYHIDDIERVVKKEKIILGIITVPEQFGQDACDRLIKAGVKGILNFSPRRLKVEKEGVILKDVDLTAQILYLTYCLKDKG